VDADFDELFERESRGLVRLATLLTGSFPVAEEIVQDAFIGLYRSWGSVVTPGVYLRTSVVNGCRTHGRRSNLARLHERRLARPVAVEGPGDTITDAVARLPHRQRSALVLRYWADLSEADIADTLGCRPGTVKSLLSRAIETLRNEVEK
jgi:RNA polymerase sigma factor (sigma-70 family)